MSPRAVSEQIRYLPAESAFAHELQRANESEQQRKRQSNEDKFLARLRAEQQR